MHPAQRNNSQSCLRSNSVVDAMTSRILLSFRSGSYVTVDRLGSSFNCVPTNKPQTKTPWNIAVSNSGTIAILFDATLHIYVGDAQRSLTLDAPFSSSRQRLVAWTQSGHLHLVIVNSLDGNFLVVNDRSEIKSCGDIRQYLSSFSPIIGIHALADSRILVVLEDCSVVAIQFSQDWSCVQSTTVLKWIKEDYKCEYSILLRIKSILLLATSAIQNGLKDSQSIRFDCVNLRWNEDIPSLSRFLHKEVVRPIITSLPDTPSMSSTSSLFFSKLVQRYLPTESSSYAVPILGVSCNRLER